MAGQSEYILEEKLITQLQELGYKKVSVKNEKELVENLKKQLEIFNKTEFSKAEFDKILNHLSKGTIFEKAKILRGKFHFVRDDGSSVWINFINQEHWCQNLFQVTHQVSQEGSFKNRYDVTLLINGFPLVQIELKRTGLELKEAFNQIDRYQQQSFSSGYGLYHFAQIFVISNGVNTKYFSNNVKQNFNKTFFWTDENNERISRLEDFANAFLEPCHIAKMITKYIVLNETHKILMVLRPYQYYAVERIVDRVKTTDKNGFIWHTTGSGKTLTSFKASQILKEIPKVEKVVFVVDRKDLDYQTQKEFDAFEKGSVDATKDTKNLVSKLSDNTKLIITTLQKLNTAITKEKHGKKIAYLKDKKVVFIFDECHRSQFGNTHQNIKKYFTKAQMIGFTGTPISEENAVGKIDGKPATTNRLFNDCLHKYVITDAIRDENVLKFSVEYVGKYREKEGSNTFQDIEVENINTKELLESDAQLEKITDYIISEYGRKTHNKTFNAMFCVSSIDVLKKYYQIFKQKKEEGKHDLKIATIFSYGANTPVGEEDTDDETGGRTLFGAEILENCIMDYNHIFGTNYSLKHQNGFDFYYKNLQQKIKNKEVDLVIVVGMFLTGFDSPRLNTLFVDKNLIYHGLIQAFSRTNRLFDEKKSQGNIVCFRNLKQATDEAVLLFSNKNAINEIIIEPIENYIEKFNNILSELRIITPNFQDVDKFQTDEEKLEFVKIFRELIRNLNVLKSFADFSWEKLQLTEYEFDAYKSKYLDIWSGNKKTEKESILNDVDFELELIHSDEINVSYILSLLSQLIDNHIDGEKLEKRKQEIRDILSSDVKLRSKRELIERFIEENLPFITNSEEIDEHFEKFWQEEKLKAFEKITADEFLNREKFENMLNDYIFTMKTPKLGDTLQILEIKPKLTQRNIIGSRIIEKMQDFVEIFER